MRRLNYHNGVEPSPQRPVEGGRASDVTHSLLSLRGLDQAAATAFQNSALGVSPGGLGNTTALAVQTWRNDKNKTREATGVVTETTDKEDTTASARLRELERRADALSAENARLKDDARRRHAERGRLEGDVQRLEGENRRLRAQRNKILSRMKQIMQRWERRAQKRTEADVDAASVVTPPMDVTGGE